MNSIAGAQNQFCAAGPGVIAQCEKFTPSSKSIAGQPPNNSSKPTPLRGVGKAS
jgi:hypothetical protein